MVTKLITSTWESNLAGRQRGKKVAEQERPKWEDMSCKAELTLRP